jgi:uncharacterized protein YecT (DUF1311 family)
MIEKKRPAYPAVVKLTSAWIPLALGMSLCLSFRTSAAAPPKCTQDEVLFHGKCLSHNECCDEAVCPAGTVLEYQDNPACVPCASARTQLGMNFCVSAEYRKVDAQLNADYKKLLADFPKLARNLRETQRVWVPFRDKLCDAMAATYERGSVQPFIRSGCLVAETKRQLQRLSDLREAFSSEE